MWRQKIGIWRCCCSKFPHLRVYSSRRNENEPTAAKRCRHSLSLNRKGATCMTKERFAFVADTMSEVLSQNFVPKNSEKSTQWALSTFLMQCNQHNECFSEESEKQVPYKHTGKDRSRHYLFRSLSLCHSRHVIQLLKYLFAYNVTIYNAPPVKSPSMLLTDATNSS